MPGSLSAEWFDSDKAMITLGCTVPGAEGIGISLRVMPYTEVESKDMKIIGDSQKRVARNQNAQLVSLPISQSIHERDNRFVQQLLMGYDNVMD